MEILNRKTLNHPHNSLSRTAMILRGSWDLFSLPLPHTTALASGVVPRPFVVCRHRHFLCSCPCVYNGAFPATANLRMLGSLAVYTSSSNGNQRPIPDWITCCYSNRFTGHIELKIPLLRLSYVTVSLHQHPAFLLSWVLSRGPHE